jgi:hypothetical protein
MRSVRRDRAENRDPYVTGSAVQAKRKERHVLSEQSAKAFGTFYDTARQNDILDPKTTLLVHLAAAMSAGCYP